MRKALLRAGWQLFKLYLRLIGQRYDFQIVRGDLYKQEFVIEGEITRVNGTVEKLGNYSMYTW